MTFAAAFTTGAGVVLGGMIMALIILCILAIIGALFGK